MPRLRLWIGHRWWDIHPNRQRRTSRVFKYRLGQEPLNLPLGDLTMAGYLGFTQSFLRCCRLFCRALTLLVCCLAAACIGTQKLPRILAFGADYYPPASARLGEEGRVLIEFQVNETFRPGGVAIREPDPSPRLNEGAKRLINTLVFDRSDPIK